MSDVTITARRSGLTGEQADILAEALADAVAFRQPRYDCPGCMWEPIPWACPDHFADEARAEAYISLAAELGLEAPEI